MIAGPPLAPIPVVSVRADLHQKMSSTAGGLSALRASMPWRTVAVNATNIHATVADPGEDAISILLTAHYDGVGDDPAQRLPAACDNASGVAVVIEAARVLAPLLPDGVGLSVALLDGEEVGAVGSAHHAPQVRPGTYVITWTAPPNCTGRPPSRPVDPRVACWALSTGPVELSGYRCGPADGVGQSALRGGRPSRHRNRHGHSRLPDTGRRRPTVLIPIT